MQDESTESCCEKELRDMQRWDLLHRYSMKTPRDYVQLDGFLNVTPGDDPKAPDSDGDCIYRLDASDLRNAEPHVRVQILNGTNGPDALRVLRKIVEWLACFQEPEIRIFADQGLAVAFKRCDAG
jgi:hypothetical protein